MSRRRSAPSLAAGVGALVVAAATLLTVGGSPADGGAPTTSLRCGDLWTGGAGTNDWGTAANWNGGVPNGMGVDACIPSGSTVTITGASFSVGALTLAAGSTLDIGPTAGTGARSGSLSVGSALDNDGTLALAPGGLINLGPTATLTNEPAGVLAFGIGGPTGTPTAAGRITGGTLDAGGSVDTRFVDGYRPSPGAEYVVYRGNPIGTFASVLDGARPDYAHAGAIGLAGGAPAAPTSTAVATDIERSPYGQMVRFTATVTSSGQVPAGSVSFSADGRPIGTAPTTDAATGTTTAGGAATTATTATSATATTATSTTATSTTAPSASAATTATATLDSSDLEVGTHSITATYVGDVFSDSSSAATLTQIVVPDPTSVTVTSAPESPAPGQPITYTATVMGIAGSGGASPGTVSFTDNGSPIAGCQSVPVPAVHGSTEPAATCAVTGGPDSTHLIVAAYGGDAHDAASRGSLREVIGQIPTQTSVASSVTTFTFGESVSLTATVTPTATVMSTSGTVGPTGTVTFFDDGTPLGSAPLVPAGSGATATFVTSTLVSGHHEVTAAYAGDAAAGASTSAAPLRLDVAEVPTTVTLASSANPVVASAGLTLTATIGATIPGETGHVQFADDGSMIGMAPVSDGQATLQTSLSAQGSHSITAVYEGDDNFVGTSSVDAVDETVVGAPGLTTTTVVASPGTLTYGESVTLTATVVATGPDDPTGLVTFTDAGSLLGSSVLSTSDGTTSASMLEATLALGPNAITATYTPDAGSVTGSSGATSVVVSPAPTSVVIASSDDPYVFGEPVTVSATVFPVTGFGEAGTVTFYDNGAAIGSAPVTYGQAELTTEFHQVGTDLIKARYGGGPDFLGSSTTDPLAELAGS